MKEHIFPAIRVTIVCMVFFVGFYTLLILFAAQFTPNNGKGDVVVDKGKKYYINIGQQFTDDKYFYSRPSAVAYNAAGAGGSNKGPANPEYLQQVQIRIDTFMVHNPSVTRYSIPADIVTASGSGLDPHISFAAAQIQVDRISKIRGIAKGNIEQLILSNIEAPLMGFLGIKKVNVLKLNLALDNLK